MAALVITPEIEAAAQRLAEATGTTPMEAVVEALRKQVATIPMPKPPETPEEREARLLRIDEIIRQLHALPWDRSMTNEEAVGYDEDGLPYTP